jgi:putative SOS response-associated peptidase YedK
MCARYTLLSPADLLAERFGLLQPPDLWPRFNIAPSQQAPVIGTKAGSKARGLALFKWGFIPHWAQGDPGKKPVNARAETVATTPMFADALRQRRCIVLADGFYEWKTVTRKSCRRTADSGVTQTEPAKRQVAIKPIKQGMDSWAVLTRFDAADRQALAVMDYPNIARIYNGDVTPVGQPFFVM